MSDAATLDAAAAELACGEVTSRVMVQYGISYEMVVALAPERRRLTAIERQVLLADLERERLIVEGNRKTAQSKTRPWARFA